MEPFCVRNNEILNRMLDWVIVIAWSICILALLSPREFQCVCVCVCVWVRVIGREFSVHESVVAVAGGGDGGGGVCDLSEDILHLRLQPEHRKLVPG